MLDIKIRSESAGDFDAIHELTAAAFGSVPIADLIDHLRADDALLLSQVAEVDGVVVGHAAYSNVSISDSDAVHQCPALGPIAVAPAHQRRGIGSALVRAGLTTLQGRGYGLLFLVGSPGYYPRFGFQPAQPLGFTSDYVHGDGPHEHFMVAVLDERAPGIVRGHVRFHPAFHEAEQAEARQ